MSALNLYVALCTVGMIVFAYYATRWRIAATEAQLEVARLLLRQREILMAKRIDIIADPNVQSDRIYMLLRGTNE